jgi:hypothetical protein
MGPTPCPMEIVRELVTTCCLREEEEAKHLYLDMHGACMIDIDYKDGLVFFVQDRLDITSTRLFKYKTIKFIVENTFLYSVVTCCKVLVLKEKISIV